MKVRLCGIQASVPDGIAYLIGGPPRGGAFLTPSEAQQLGEALALRLAAVNDAAKKLGLRIAKIKFEEVK